MSNTAVAAALLPLTATFCRVSDSVNFSFFLQLKIMVGLFIKAHGPYY